LSQRIALSWFVDFRSESWWFFQHVPLYFQSRVKLILGLHHEILTVLMESEISLVDMTDLTIRNCTLSFIFLCLVHPDHFQILHCTHVYFQVEKLGCLLFRLLLFLLFLLGLSLVVFTAGLGCRLLIRFLFENFFPQLFEFVHIECSL